MSEGLFEANLGGNLFKKRMPGQEKAKAAVSTGNGAAAAH
jgi:hypothetical protein